MSARNVPPPPKRAMSFFAHRKQQQQQQHGPIHNLKSSSQQQSSSSSLSLDSPSPLLPQESSNASRQQGKRKQRAPRTRQRDNESLHASSSLSDDDDDEEEYHREKEEEESSGHDDNFNAKDYHSKRTKHKNSRPLSCLKEDDREQQRTAQEAAVASAATTLPYGRGKSNRRPFSPRTIDTGTGGSDASAVKKPSVSLSLAQTPQSPAAVLLSKHAAHHSSAHALDNDTNDTTSTNNNSSSSKNNNKVMLSANAQTALAEAICATIESAAAEASANHDGGYDDGRDGADDHNFRNDAMAVVPPEHLAKAMAAGWPKHVVQSAARVACEREREQAALSLSLQRRTKRNGGTIGSTRRTTPRGRTAKRQGRPSLFSSSSSSDEEGMQNDWRQQQQQQQHHHQSRRRHDHRHRHHRQSRKRARKEDSGDARQQQHDRACPRKTGNRRSRESSRSHILDHVAQASRSGQQQQQSPPSTELSAVSHVLTDSIYRYTLETSLSRGELRQLSEWDHAVQQQVHAENSLVLENVELVAEEKRSSRQVEHIRDELVILRMSTLRVRGEAEQLEKKLSQIDEGCRSRKGASRFLAALETIGKVCREEQSEQTNHENK